MRTSSSYALVVPSVLGGYLGNVRKVYRLIAFEGVPGVGVSVAG